MVVLGKSSKQVGGWFGSGCSPGPVAILYIVYLQHSSVSKVFGHPSNLSQLYTHDRIVLYTSPPVSMTAYTVKYRPCIILLLSKESLESRESFHVYQ